MAILHGLEPSPREALAAALGGTPVGSDPAGAIEVDGNCITVGVTGEVRVNIYVLLGTVADGPETLAKRYRAAVASGVIS